MNLFYKTYIFFGLFSSTYALHVAVYNLPYPFFNIKNNKNLIFPLLFFLLIIFHTLVLGPREECLQWSERIGRPVIWCGLFFPVIRAVPLYPPPPSLPRFLAATKLRGSQGPFKTSQIQSALKGPCSIQVALLVRGGNIVFVLKVIL